MKGIIAFSPGKRTSKIIMVYLAFCLGVAWLGRNDLTSAAAFVTAAGAGILGAKFGNALEGKAERPPNGGGGAGGA